MPKVVITSLNGDQGPHLELLPANGFEVHLEKNSGALLDEDGLINALKDADAVIAGSEPYTPRVIESLPKLRVIARSGVGYDAVDLDACDKASIAVTTTPGVNHHSVAEHTIAILMSVARGFPELDRKVREDRWTRIPRPRVMGTTLGIVGLGRIGQAVATRAVGLGMNVIAFEPYPNKEFVEKWKIELIDRDELFKRSEFISLHCPMSVENKHLINADSLATMKKGAVLINTARGGLVDEIALYDALKSGQLMGAGLDVFEAEPLPLSSPLLELDNILLAGHVAGLDKESQHDTFKMVAEIIIDFYNGGWPAEVIQNLKGVTDWKWNRN